MKLNKINFPELNKPTNGLEEVVTDIMTDEARKKKEKKETFWAKLWRAGKLKKKNMVAVIYLRNNGNAEPMEVQSKDGFFNIYGRTYHENMACIYSMTKNRVPLAIIPEWSLIPIGTKRWVDQSMIEKFAELQDHTLRGIRHAEFVRMGGDKGLGLNAKSVIGFIVLGIIGIAIASQYLA